MALCNDRSHNLGIALGLRCLDWHFHLIQTCHDMACRYRSFPSDAKHLGNGKRQMRLMLWLALQTR